MIKIDNIDVFNFEGALRGMRNPMNSWGKSDSEIKYYFDECEGADKGIYRYTIGPNDLVLAQKLIAAGPEHAKFMRQIFVSMDITAPIYFAKEFDTYKVSTVRNSCSTMHKIHSKEFTLDDFSYEHLDGYSIDLLEKIIDRLNDNRKHYNETKDKDYWWQLIQLLPSSYNQKFTWTANYQILRNIYQQRRSHKLDEWRDFCKMIEELPYSQELICYNIGGNENEA